MNIAFLAHDKKKELMVQFCTAYKSVLMKHNLFATATTGRLIADNTGLPITLLLSHKQGGHQQINARIAYNEIDLVLLFTDPNTVIYGHNMKNDAMFGSLMGTRSRRTMRSIPRRPCIRRMGITPSRSLW